MAGPDYNILFSAPNPGAAFANAFQQGMQTRRQDMARNALAALVQNPNDPSALADLARVDPSTAMDFRTQQAKLAQDNVKQFQSTIDAGASALQRLTAQGMPMDQAYQTVRQTLIANGFPGADHIPAQADENYIKGIMSLAKPDTSVQDPSSVREFEYAKQQGFPGSYTDFIQMVHPPSPVSIPYGATITQPSQPSAMPRVSTPQEASQLPPGTKFIMPDGRIGTVPGGAGGNASGGFPSGGQ